MTIFRARRLLPALAAAVVLSVGLTGCITVQLPGCAGPNSSSGSTAGPVTAPGASITCGADGITIVQAGNYGIDGDCSSLTIDGPSITVDVSAIGALVIRGDRVTVTADNIDSINLSGNDNAIKMAQGTSIAIAGDRNSITGTELGALTIQGNENRIGAETVVTVTNSGDRNEINARQG